MARPRSAGKRRGERGQELFTSSETLTSLPLPCPPPSAASSRERPSAGDRRRRRKEEEQAGKGASARHAPPTGAREPGRKGGASSYTKEEDGGERGEQKESKRKRACPFSFSFGLSFCCPGDVSLHKTPVLFPSGVAWRRGASFLLRFPFIRFHRCSLRRRLAPGSPKDDRPRRGERRLF